MKNLIPVRYNRPECCAPATVTLPSDGETISGTMFGNAECFDGDRFYQYLLTDDGELYKLYYDIPDGCDDLSDLDYEHPEDALVADLADDDDIPDHWDILDLVADWKWA